MGVCFVPSHWKFCNLNPLTLSTYSNIAADDFEDILVMKNLCKYKYKTSIWKLSINEWNDHTWIELKALWKKGKYSLWAISPHNVFKSHLLRSEALENIFMLEIVKFKTRGLADAFSNLVLSNFLICHNHVFNSIQSLNFH